MREGSKATHRRFRDWETWLPIFGDAKNKKAILDLGPGDDLLEWPGAKVIGFDKPGLPEGHNYTKTSAEQGFKEGDINRIDEYFDSESFDCIHASQVFEHVHDPKDVIRRCIKILKPNGHLVLTVPDFDLYEHGVMPSKWNQDHKTTWSMWRKDTEFHERFPHIYVPGLESEFKVVRSQLVDTNYNYSIPVCDQTLLYENLVEAFIEIVIKKS